MYTHEHNVLICIASTSVNNCAQKSTRGKYMRPIPHKLQLPKSTRAVMSYIQGYMYIAYYVSVYIFPSKNTHVILWAQDG